MMNHAEGNVLESYDSHNNGRSYELENKFFLQSGCSANPDCSDKIEHCETPDGKQGVCTQYGMCCSSFLLDQDQDEWRDRTFPHCSFPMTRNGCKRYCTCYSGKHGGTVSDCVSQCESKFVY